MTAFQERVARRSVRLALLLGAAALAAIVGGSGSNGTSPPGKGQAATGMAQTNALFAVVPQSGTTLGNPKAPASLVVFADLQCPFCRQYDLNAVPTVVQRYVRTGKLRL